MLSNDLDVDSVLSVGGLTAATDEEGNTLSVSLLNGVAFSDSLYLAGQGTVSLAGGGNLQFVPDANFNGDVVFTYALSDGNSNSADQTVTLPITPVNDAPVATDDATTLAEDATTYSGAVTANDVDPDTLTYSLAPGGDVANGTLVFNPDGTFDYTPDANFNGEDSFTWSVSNGNGTGASEVIAASNFVDLIYGGDGDDFVSGLNGNDTLFGEEGDDILSGGSNDDTLNGGAGGDTLIGGAGNDTLAGGSDADRFVFLAESFNTPLQTDTILDFNASAGDVLDMSAIDANASIAGDQAFSRVGSFTGVAGQATVVFANNQTIIRFDLNGDRTTDFQIRLDGDHTATALLTGAEAPGAGGWIF